MDQMSGDSYDRPSPWERPALGSGILLVVLQLAGLAFFITSVAPKMPPVDAPAAQAAAFYTQHGGLITTNNFLFMLQTPFLLLFLAGLNGVLRRVEGGSGALAVAALGSGVAMGVILALGWLISGLGVGIAANGGDAATIKALDGMSPLSLALSTLPRALLLAATSLVLLRSQFAPRWIGWAGLALVLISVVGATTLIIGAMFPVLALGSLLFELWTLALSIALLRHTGAVAQAASRTALA